MKYPVNVTMTFNKLIVVEADSEEEAIDKCWDAWECPENEAEMNAISFDYLNDYGEINFEIGDKDDTEMMMNHPNLYAHL